MVQQQYGVAGDPDALRPADDHYERRADHMANRALEAPLAAPAAPARRAGPARHHRPIHAQRFCRTRRSAGLCGASA